MENAFHRRLLMMAASPSPSSPPSAASPSSLAVEWAAAPQLVLGCIAFFIFWMFAVWPSMRLLPIGRTAGSMLATCIMVASKLITPDQAFAAVAVNLPILALLFGTMVVSVYLKQAGLFDHLERLLLWKTIGSRSSRSISRSRISNSSRISSGISSSLGRNLLWRIAVLSAVTSALFTNDTTCVAFTPFLLGLCREHGLEAWPFLMALATSANIGSAATPIGNPQNLVIAVQGNLSFLTFLSGMLPSVLLGLLVNTALLYMVYWSQLTTCAADDSLAHHAHAQAREQAQAAHAHFPQAHQLQYPQQPQSQAESLPQQAPAQNLPQQHAQQAQEELHQHGAQAQLPEEQPAQAQLQAEAQLAQAQAQQAQVQLSQQAQAQLSQEAQPQSSQQAQAQLPHQAEAPLPWEQAEAQLPCQQDQAQSPWEQAQAQLPWEQQAGAQLHWEQAQAQFPRAQAQLPWEQAQAQLEAQAPSLPQQAQAQHDLHSTAAAYEYTGGGEDEEGASDDTPPPTMPKLRMIAVYLVTLGMLAAMLRGLSLPWSALSAAALLIMLGWADATPSLLQVDYLLLVFFAGMFISVDGLNRTGLPSKLWTAVEPHARLGSPLGTFILSLTVLFLSNFASNVPTVLLLGARLAASTAASSSSASAKDGDVERAWLVLSWLSTVAGNLCLIGSAANLIVSEQCSRQPKALRYDFAWWRHLRFGLPSTLIVITLGLLPLVLKS